jgi:hypothetical protein
VEKQIQKKKISGEPDPQPVDKSAVCVRKIEVLVQAEQDFYREKWQKE